MKPRVGSKPAAMLVVALTYAAAAFAVAQMLDAGAVQSWTSFLLILLLACIGSRIRLQLPGLERPVSLAFPFAFAALPIHPPWAAWLILLGAELTERLAEGENLRTALGRWVYHGALSAVGVFCALRAYAAASVGGELFWPVATALGAIAYFVAVSLLDSLRSAAEQGRPVWSIWNRSWFWAAPIYLLAPFGVSVARLFSDARSGWDAVMGSALIVLAFWYLNTYFPRLKQQQHHAQQLADIRQRALETLAVAIEAKDGSTAGHLQRVKLLASRLARTVGCTSEEVRTLQLAALLHDVGKVGVPDYILQKPSRLTDREFQEITAHASIGAGIVSAMDFPEPVDDIVLSHHEHWDGSGYPRGLKGDEIPRLARILTVVDCFDALVSDRPYRKALPIDKAIELLSHQSGKIFDPEILDRFLMELPSYEDELIKQLEDEARLQSEGKPKVRKVRQTWVEKECDIVYSSRSAAMQKLSRRPDHMVAFYEAMTLLGADLRYDRTMAKTLAIIGDICGADICALLLSNPAKRAYTLQSAVGLPELSLGRLSIPQDRGLIGQAASLRIPIIEDSTPAAELDLHNARHFDEMQSSLVTPLLIEDKPVGMLLLCSRHTGAFDHDQSLLLSLLAEKLASTLIAAQHLRKLQIQAETDPVTKLPNSRAFYPRLEQEINRARRTEGGVVAILFMDLDGLKMINDSFGHPAGDKLLAAAALRLRNSLRSYDFVARIGGDEFVAVMPGVAATDIQQTVAILKKAVSAQPVALGNGNLAKPFLSIGAAHYPTDSDDPDALVGIADQRMYANKEAARHSLEEAPVAGD
ncbi:MAG: diguanylate cyclase [Acidobacteria bacterium]|nr:diguanylate cyclase [Acidobacteriota bacterium]